ncbi:hypothetical protein B0T09DRAFT_317641 [Sordaria sp. MPI-SDFR-AT-0083]|nr:hypothetical protein B0T09DRAFT_317641 [Sordaria sp. MPI-SDFR-AT-0083]
MTLPTVTGLENRVKKPCGYSLRSHFVRIAHNEVSVSHPDRIKNILLAPLHKANWYKFLSIPDYRYQTPMSTTDPKKKAERSRHLAAGYTMSNLLQTEDSIDNVID